MLVRGSALNEVLAGLTQGEEKRGRVIVMDIELVGTERTFIDVGGWNGFAVKDMPIRVIE